MVDPKQQQKLNEKMRVYIKTGLLIDGVGANPIENGALLVQNGVIQAVGSATSFPLPEDSVLIDLSDFTVLPGLVDAHVHLIGDPEPGAFTATQSENDERLLLRAIANSQKALAAGLTTVRDCGGRGTITASLEKAIGEGLVGGPRIVNCSAPITTTGGHCYFLGQEAEGIDGVKQAVRKTHKAGADFVKVMVTGGGITPGSNSRASQYSQAELSTIVEDAHRLGKRVAGHVHGTEGIARAAHAGFDTLEHVSWLARYQSDRDYDPKVVNEILEKGIIVCRTIAGFERIPLEEASAGHKYWPDYEVFRNMVRDGIKLAAGTDAGIDYTPISDYALTLETMAGLGAMNNREVIAAATINAAEALGIDDQIGTLENGKRADLVAVKGNPYQDLRVLRNIDMVIQGGAITVIDGSLSFDQENAPNLFAKDGWGKLYLQK